MYLGIIGGSDHTPRGDCRIYYSVGCEVLTRGIEYPFLALPRLDSSELALASFGTVPRVMNAKLDMHIFFFHARLTSHPLHKYGSRIFKSAIGGNELIDRVNVSLLDQNRIAMVCGGHLGIDLARCIRLTN